jgi:hypothetical protein
MISSEPTFQILASRIKTAVEKIGLNLHGQRVLTEAASGPYMATAVLAAVAGAEHVTACTRDSRWGRFDEIKANTLKLASLFDVACRIDITNAPKKDAIRATDVVTNLGFLRPITRDVIHLLPPHAAISLMWEPWEFRKEDIDIEACRECGIPIIATNERHPNLNTFRSVGLLAVKLLLECHCEIAGLNITVVGSDPFGKACSDMLDSIGAVVTVLDPQEGWPNQSAFNAFKESDAVLFVEHRYHGELLGLSTPELVGAIQQRSTPIVHICGAIDSDHMKSCGIEKHPAHSVPSGFMTLTTAYIGAKPVVDLHAAGLHVASIVSRARVNGASISSALDKAIESGYGLKLNFGM